MRITAKTIQQLILVCKRYDAPMLKSEYEYGAMHKGILNVSPVESKAY
jgi:hypothetical protein